MKRKRDEDGLSNKASDAPNGARSSFEDFGLDARILQGVLGQKWATPTPVQARAIPLALDGKDILARSGTGTGKTAAYLIPILEHTLREKHMHRERISTLILVPTRELALQVTKLALQLAANCGQEVRVANIAGKEDELVQRARLSDFPDIVVATPARASANAEGGALPLKDLARMVIDEGDLVMSYGFQDDLDKLSKAIPRGVQLFMMSATLSTEIDALQGLFCRNPVVVKLDDVEKDSQQVKQYVIQCAEDEKFLLVYAMFLLKLIKGKAIIFVGDVDRSYRVKLFLEQFGVKSCVLNSELPVASRLHIVEEFNKDVYDILIASDENEIVGMENSGSDKTGTEDGGGKRNKKTKRALSDANESKKVANEPQPESRRAQRKARDAPRISRDAGVSRGIDFRNVACVLNFDMPLTYKSYFHRIGRTARAGKSGTAISFVIPKDKFRKHKPTSFAGSVNDEDVLSMVAKHQKDGQALEDYQFDMKRLEPFRYRFADALKSVTRIAIREARLKELRQELMASKKLSTYFDENPEALVHLRHDKHLQPARIKPHLKHVPEYLLPAGSRRALVEDIGFVAEERKDTNRQKKINRWKGKGRKKAGKNDPLKSFSTKRNR